MDALRPDQVELLDKHREHAFDVLVTASAAYRGDRKLGETPEGKALLGQVPPLLVSIAVSAAVAAVETRRMQQDKAKATNVLRVDAADIFPAVVLQSLRRRRLPFTPTDVELVLDLGTSTMTPDEIFARSFETLSFGVAAAANLLDAKPGSAPVIAALGRAGRAIDALGLTPTSDPGRLRRRIRAILAANVPGGLLDLSAVEEGDAWGTTARAVLRSHADRWEEVQNVLAQFAAARGSKPTQSWRRRMAILLEAHPEAATLARELVEPVLEIDLVSTPDDVPWPPSWLLAPGNEDLVRGAVRACGLVDEPWVVALLGRLALRCAAPSPDPTVTTALSGKVAGGAVETLIALDCDESRAELRLLLGEIRRRDLVQRIGTALGESTDARTDQLRLEKQRAVRSKANPQPPLEQRDTSRSVRSEVAPRLWELGFTVRSGRTFWRHRPDRVEVLHVASRRGERFLEVGVWFTAPRRLRAPELRDGVPSPSTAQCDLTATFESTDLVRSALKAEGWFLRWEEPAAVLAFLLSDETDHETRCGDPGSPMRNYLIGYLSAPAGRPELASEHLARAASWYRGWLEDRLRTSSGDVDPAQEAWVAGLEADAKTA